MGGFGSGRRLEYTAKHQVEWCLVLDVGILAGGPVSPGDEGVVPPAGRGVRLECRGVLHRPQRWRSQAHRRAPDDHWGRQDAPRAHHGTTHVRWQASLLPVPRGAWRGGMRSPRRDAVLAAEGPSGVRLSALPPADVPQLAREDENTGTAPSPLLRSTVADSRPFSRRPSEPVVEAGMIGSMAVAIG
jgi:hypothetical protein